MPITLRARSPHIEPTSKPQRRRLAPNVICLFPEAMPPVVNPRHRGPYPRPVVILRRWPRIRPGVICEMCGTSLPENQGKRVLVVSEDDDRWWNVVAIDGAMITKNRVTGVRNGGSAFKIVAPEQNMRRVWDR